jgi:hypothetical protein
MPLLFRKPRSFVRYFLKATFFRYSKEETELTILECE